MTSPAVQALVAALAIAFVLQLIGEWLLGSPRHNANRRRNPRPVLSTALLLAAGLMAVLTATDNPADSGSARHGLLWAMAGMAILHVAGLLSDMNRPSTRRHFIATILAGFCLVFGGFGSPYIGLPGLGTIELGRVAGAGLTVLWVFLVVSIFEVCALVPLMAGLAAVVVGIGAFLPIDAWKTVPGLVLAGILIGAVAGRSLGNAVLVRSQPSEKSEILVLGYTAAAASLATYLKSITMASLLLPIGIITVIIVVLVSQSFDRSLILRASPRE